MPDWKVAETGGELVGVAVDLEASSGLGTSSRLDIGMRELREESAVLGRVVKVVPPGELDPDSEGLAGSEFTVVGVGSRKWNRARVLQTVPRGREGGVGATAVEYGSPQVVLYQRGAEETAWEFLGRVAGRVAFADSYDPRDVDIGRVEAACPVGLCLLLGNALPAELGFLRAIEAVAARGAGVAGAVQTVAGEEYRLASVCGDEADGDQRVELEAGRWRLMSAPWDQGFARLGIRREMFGPAQEMVRRLFDPSVRNLGADDRDPVPVAPCTVRVGGRVWFASRVSTWVGLAVPDEGVVNVVTRLELAEVGAVQGRRGGGASLVGVIADWQPEDAVGIGVEPPAHLGTLSEVARPLGDWSIGGSVPLVAIQASPGFDREDEVAFYSRWEPGDMVLVDVIDGGPAIVRGAVRHRRDTEADVEIGGQDLVVNAGNQVEIGAEAVSVRAKELVDLQSRRVQIAGSIRVAK